MSLDVIWVVGLFCVACYVPFVWRAMGGDDEKNPVLWSTMSLGLAVVIGYQRFFAPIALAIEKSLPPGDGFLTQVTTLLIMVLCFLMGAMFLFGVCWFLGDVFRLALVRRRLAARRQ